jgi:hypothetical protein
MKNDKELLTTTPIAWGQAGTKVHEGRTKTFVVSLSPNFGGCVLCGESIELRLA